MKDSGNHQPELKKQLTVGQIAMVAIGGSIGTGLFLGSGAAIQVAGPAVVVSYLLSAAIAWTVAMALGELSSAHPAAGSFGVYAEIYLNDWAGFVARCGYWLCVVVVIGSELVAAGTYMRVWYPHVPTVLWMIVFGILLLVINLLPVGDYGRVEYWFAAIKVVTIFVFILVGTALVFGGKLQPQYVEHGGFAPKGWKSALLATAFGLYSFLGIEMVAVSSEEAKSRLAISRATRIAFFILVIVYVGAMAVLVGVMPWDRAGVTQSPFVTVFQVARIPAAKFMMNLVVLSAALSAANATVFVASRMLLAMAEAGYAPSGLTRVNRHNVPVTALLISMIGIAAAILIQLATPNAYLYIISAALVGGMMAWLISLAAHVRFRQRLAPEQLASMPLRSPLGTAGSIVGFIAILAAVGSTAWVQQLWLTAACAVPFLLALTAGYYVMKRWRAREAAR